MLIEIGKSQIFEIQTKLMDGESPSIKDINDLALAIKRLGEAQASSVKLEQEMRKQLMTEAAQVAESSAKKLGLTLETVNKIKNDILGIA
jgi:hypothetical protein